MKTLNIDDLVLATTGNKPFNDARNHPLMPQHYGGLGSFRWLICGKSGSGKTNIVISCIMQGLIKFDKLYLLVRDPTQSKYVLLQKWLNTLEKQFKETHEDSEDVSFYTVISNPDEVPDTDSFDSSIINLVIIDDMLMEKNQSKFIDYFVRGRQRSMDCIYLTQSYHATDKTLRKQCDYFTIFEPNSKSDLVQLAKDHSLTYDFKEFKNLLGKATNSENSFLFIDRRTPVKILQLRKGFDQVWNSAEQKYENLFD